MYIYIYIYNIDIDIYKHQKRRRPARVAVGPSSARRSPGDDSLCVCSLEYTANLLA